MTTLTLPDELVERIQTIAQREGRPIEVVVADMVDHYPPQTEADKPATEPGKPKHNPLQGLVGLLDDDIQETDLSSTIRETLKQHIQVRHGT